MKIFLTGATGFIGSQLARMLVQLDCEVVALVRPQSDLRRIQDIQSQLQLVQGDLLQGESLSRILDAVCPDCCIHLGWYAEPGKYPSALENLSLVSAGMNLALRLAALGCRRFVGVGTCFEYDASAGYFSEDSPVNPNSLYAASKLSLGLLLDHLMVKTTMKTAWVRLFYQYGPFEDPRRLVPSVILSLLKGEQANTTEGRQVRDFLHVEDVASAIWAVACSDLTGAVNVGSGDPVTVRTLVGLIGELTGRSDLINAGALPYREGDPMFVCANNTRLLENTNWKPAYDLRSGLYQTIEWWRKNL